jgi:hypothetical protein
MTEEHLEESIEKVDKDVKWLIGIIISVVIACSGGVAYIVGEMVTKSEERVMDRICNLERRLVHQLEKTENKIVVLDKELDENGRKIAVLFDRDKREFRR